MPWVQMSNIIKGPKVSKSDEMCFIQRQAKSGAIKKIQPICWCLQNGPRTHDWILTKRHDHGLINTRNESIFGSIILPIIIITSFKPILQFLGFEFNAHICLNIKYIPAPSLASWARPIDIHEPELDQLEISQGLDQIRTPGLAHLVYLVITFKPWITLDSKVSKWHINAHEVYFN